MHKEVDPCIENTAVLEPSDADYLFSAKVCQEVASLYDEIRAIFVILYKRADTRGAIKNGIQTPIRVSK